jgi:hypothetical protein
MGWLRSLNDGFHPPQFVQHLASDGGVLVAELIANAADRTTSPLAKTRIDQLKKR